MLLSLSAASLFNFPLRSAGQTEHVGAPGQKTESRYISRDHSEWLTDRGKAHGPTEQPEERTGRLPLSTVYPYLENNGLGLRNENQLDGKNHIPLPHNLRAYPKPQVLYIHLKFWQDYLI